MGPDEKVIMEAEKERQGDFVFTAKETGEYRFCFDNDMSTFAEKMVDFEIAVWPLISLDYSVSEPPPPIPCLKLLCSTRCSFTPT